MVWDIVATNYIRIIEKIRSYKPLSQYDPQEQSWGFLFLKVCELLWVSIILYQKNLSRFF